MAPETPAPEPPAPTEPDAAPGLMHRLGSAGATAASLGGEGSRWRRWAVIALGALAVLFLVYFVAANWSQLPDIEWRFDPWWLAASVIALALFNALQCQVWAWILRALGGRLETPQAWSIWSVTLLARYVPTNLAMVVGRTAMAEREGVPKRVTMASIVYQLGVTLVGAAAVGAYFVIELPALRDQPLRWAAPAVPLLGLVALDPLVFHRLANLALRRLGRESLPLSLSRSAVIGFSVVAAASFGVVGVGVWAFAEAIHGVAATDVPTVVGAYSIGFTVAVATLVLPGGLGVREVAMVAALAPAMPVPVAVAVSVAIRLLQVAVELVFAAVTPLWARRARTSSGQ